MKAFVLMAFSLACFFNFSPAYGSDEGDSCVITAPSGASLRTFPATTAAKIAVIPYFSELKRLEWSNEQATVEGVTANWMKVKWQNQEGFVWGGLLCSDPHEAGLIKNSDEKVRREMNRLTLFPQNGGKIQLEDRPILAEESQSCRLVAIKEDHWIIRRTGWEWHDYLMISLFDGKQIELDAEPFFSPDRLRFFTANLDIHAGFTANRLRVYRLNQGNATLEWEIEPENWGPDQVSWQASDRISLQRLNMNNEATAAQLSLDKSKNSWQLSDLK